MMIMSKLIKKIRIMLMMIIMRKKKIIRTKAIITWKRIKTDDDKENNKQ